MRLLVSLAPAYITITEVPTGTGAVTKPTTITIPPNGNDKGTIIIKLPATYVTTTKTGDVTGLQTVTVPPSGTAPGTVIIDVPYSYITTTKTITGTGQPTTLTLATGPGTVFIQIPEKFVTMTRPHTGTGVIVGPIAVTTIPASGTDPGTVIIETPTSKVNIVTSTHPCTGTAVITGLTTVATISPSHQKGQDTNPTIRSRSLDTILRQITKKSHEKNAKWFTRMHLIWPISGVIAIEYLFFALYSPVDRPSQCHSVNLIPFHYLEETINELENI